MASQEPLYIYVESSTLWLDGHIKTYIQKLVPNSIPVDNFADLPSDAQSVYQYCDGWAVTRNFAVLNTAKSALLNAYPNSDAITRKDLLARVVEYWSSKRPDTILKNQVPITVRLTLDYCEYVDDALMEADNLELLYSLEENESKPAEERQWWILKPALIDCGAGIRIFSTAEELADNLESVDDDLEDEDEDDDESGEDVETNGNGGGYENGHANGDANGSQHLNGATADKKNQDVLVSATAALAISDGGSAVRKAKQQQLVVDENERIPSSQMRVFVAQKYISAVPVLDGRKWHVRAYILCIGRLKVYVSRDMLNLLAGERYQPPWEHPSLRSSLTNTALQDPEDLITMQSMRDYWDAPDDLLEGDWKERVFDQICEISSEVVAAATHTMADQFTTMEKCFELFAGDFLIDAEGKAFLLEVNESPAFYDVGFATPLAKRLMESVVCLTIDHMGIPFEESAETAAARARMVKVFDETATLAKVNITQIRSEQSASGPRR